MATVEQRPTLRTEIAGMSIPELAAEHGTPTYLYDSQTIKDRIEDLRQFDVIRYAQKACSNLAVVDFVRRNGVCVDAVSAGEIRRALAAGYATGGEPHPVVYTADIFDREALELCVEHDIHVNVGSGDMIDQLGPSHQDVALRCGSTRGSDMVTVRKQIRAAPNLSMVFGMKM